MAAIVGQVQAAPGQAGTKTDMAPVLQQLNLASLRTRTQDLHNAISRILSSFHNLPTLKWYFYPSLALSCSLCDSRRLVTTAVIKKLVFGCS